jgi:hypothetical protein
MINEGIIALRNENKIALIYKAINNDIFHYLSNSEEKGLVSTYLRYLIDVCQ